MTSIQVGKIKVRDVEKCIRKYSKFLEQESLKKETTSQANSIVLQHH